jgi:SurA-like protein
MKGPLRRALRISGSWRIHHSGSPLGATLRGRARLAGIRVAAVIVVAFAFAAAGCGAEHEPAALVGDAAISAEQVDRIVNHAREEARREGKDFPAEGTEAYQVVRRQALDLLVYHEELAQRAKALGVTPAASELTPPAGGETEEGGSQDDAFLRESVRGQVLYRKLYERVTRNVSVSAAEVRAYRSRYPGVPPAQARRNLLDTKRNALMARWVAQMKRDYADKVRYGSDYKIS